MRETGSPYLGNRVRANNRRYGYHNDGYIDMEDGLVIEDNTIYEIDLDCYECLREQRKKLL